MPKQQTYRDLLDEIIEHKSENEWIEFKSNYHSAEEIGKLISGLSNSACIHNEPKAYLIFGVKDETFEIEGTSFKPRSKKKGNEEIEHWISTRLEPKIDFRIIEFEYSISKQIVIFSIPATRERPVSFYHNKYIRVGSMTRNLEDFPEKEMKIWNKKSVPFEKEIAIGNLATSDIFKYLSIESYYDLTKKPFPISRNDIITTFIREKLITRTQSGLAITKLGALLLGKNLDNFGIIKRKSVRVVVYKGTNKVNTEREHTGVKGYAVGFKGLIEWVNSQLPANEEIEKALRKDVRMYPEVTIRELLANALIHQDLSEKGRPMIEIYSDRIEISNPGIPKLSLDRFIDGHYSKNELLADLMRRMGVCEEKGSGIDKAFFYNEKYQLPPINFLVQENRTKVVLYSYKELNALDKDEKIKACYQHTCLNFVSNQKTNNKSLRERFNIEDKNSATASRIIKDTLNANLIKENDPNNKSKKHINYIPYWA